MALPALVLVHGGSLAADSWDLTVNEINRQAPELTVLAVDLPGRRSKPGELRTVTIADFVESVVADVENAGLDDIAIVAHFAGWTDDSRSRCEARSVKGPRDGNGCGVRAAGRVNNR